MIYRDHLKNKTMKPLHEDQIHNDSFMKLCTHIWSSQKNDVFIDSMVEKLPQLQVVFRSESPNVSSGIIFIGINQLIEDFFDEASRDVNWIVIHRTNDRSFTEAMYKKKPSNIKHIYTVDCAVNYPDVSAIPIGFATIGGEDEIIKSVAKELVEQAKTKVFVRYNYNNSGYTEQRKNSIPILKTMPFVKVVEYQIGADEFHREIKAHQFTMSLKGCGADACRTWDAIALGSIPIVTDCIEMRHFEDLPLIFCPNDLSIITPEWLDSNDLSKKSTERMRASYWDCHIKETREQLGI